MTVTPPEKEHESRRRFGLMAQPVAVAVLCSILVLSGLSAMRWVSLGSPLLFAIVPIAPTLLLSLVLGVAVWSAIRKSGLVFLFFGALAIVLTTSSLSRGFPPRIFCGQPDASNAITIYSHNVSWEAGDPDSVVEQIRAVDPDVVLLQEADAEFMQVVQNTLGTTYEFTAVSQAQQTLSLATISKWPLRDVVDHIDDTGMINPLLLATIETPTGDVRVANVHLSAPGSRSNLPRREAELAFLQNPAQSNFEADLLIGDFNSSTAHRDFRQFLKPHWTDASSSVGCSVTGTWSPLGAGPGLFELDRALLANESDQHLDLLGFETHSYAGSDHRSISVTLATK